MLSTDVHGSTSADELLFGRYYTAFSILHHEKRIGKRLKNSNVKFRYKRAKKRYDEAMKRTEGTAGRMIAAFIFLMVCAVVCAEKAKDPNRALPYRGMRMSGSSIFFVTKIEHEDERDDIAEIKIKFNIPADPRTLQRQLIHINGKPLPPDAVLSFNKAGNKIRILVPMSFIFGTPDGKNRQFYIDLPEAKSFNHIPLYSSHFSDMRRNTEYKFVFSNLPREMPPRGKPPMRPPSIEKPPEGKPLQEPLGENFSAPYGEYLRFEEDD